MANSEEQQFSWSQIAIDGFDAVRARKWLIIAVTLIAAAASAVREITTPSYGAEMLVAVTPLTAKGDLIEAVPETFEPKAYERLLLSNTVVGLVVERLNDDGHFKNGASPSVDQFRQDLWMHVDLLDQTTRPVSFSPILRLNAKAETPDLAMAKIQAWAAIAIEVGNKALSAKIDAASETLAVQRAQFEATLDDLGAQLRTEKGQWNLDVIRKDIELAQDRLDLLTQARQTAEQEADAACQQIATVEAQLANEEPIRVYRKSPSDDAFFIAGESADKDSGAPADAVMITEEENIVYTELKTLEHTYRAVEAEATAKLSTMSTQIETAERELSALKRDLAEHEIVQDRLTADLTIAQTVYTDVAQASSFSNAAQSLTLISSGTGERAVGLNLVSDRVFPYAYEGVFGSRLSVVIATLTAFGLITAFVLVREVGLTLLRAFIADQPHA